MNKIEYGQAGKPTGLLGQLFGWIMSIMNIQELKSTISLLEIQPDDKVLEIGFGPGKSFKLLSLLTNKMIFGIDHSAEMVNLAKRNNKVLINENRLNLQIGNAENLEFPDNYFDKIFSINCIYFWENPGKTIQHIKDKLRPNGYLIITIRNSTHGLNKFYNANILSDLFKQNGLKEINVIEKGKHIYVVGKK